MESCFPVGNSALIYSILRFDIEGNLSSVAVNQTADKDFVTIKFRWGIGRVRIPLILELVWIAKRTHETGSWLVVLQKD